MKRSEVNAAIRTALALLDSFRWSVPEWAHWSGAHYSADAAAATYLRRHQMGWDVTDFGSGQFAARGLTLLCLRNGLADAEHERSYAEKLLFVGAGQETPAHRHLVKTEDIINRGGGNLIMQFAASDGAGTVVDTVVDVRVDGLLQRLEPWQMLRLVPGQSVLVERGVYHRITGEAGHGCTLAAEVSSVNDDTSDNYFLEPVGRFARIDEDEPPLRLLWNEIGVT